MAADIHPCRCPFCGCHAHGEDAVAAYRETVVAWLRAEARIRHVEAASTRGAMDCSSYDNDVRAEELEAITDAIACREPERWARERGDG